jgi:DNA polymerase-3 subunit epsilon
MRYVAIDFETANSRRVSACALGIAVVEGATITESRSWLIRPRELIFDPYNVFIHGITPEDVENEPEFPALWPEIRTYTADSHVIAHFASFDLSVLRHVLNEYTIAYPELYYFCSHMIAKGTWKGLPNYGLSSVAEHLGIQFRHHDPEEDAVACAKIAIRACREHRARSLDELAERIEILKGELYLGGYKPCRKKPTKPSDIVPTTQDFDEEHALYGKQVVFTGTLQSMVRREAMQQVVDCGGLCPRSVTRSTNYLVLGDQDFSKFRGGTKSKKLRKAESLIADGADLEIIPEEQFLALMGKP